MLTLSRQLLPAALAGLMPRAAAPAHAQNLVKPAGASGSPDAVFDGVNSLCLTPYLDPTVQIAQSLATTPGANYTLSFYADDYTFGSLPLNNHFNVDFGGTVVGGGPVTVPATLSSAPSYTFYSYTVKATTAFTGLTFATTSGIPDNILLDDVSVVPAAVPEASTTASFGLLLVLGMGGIVVAAKRKKMANANSIA